MSKKLIPSISLLFFCMLISSVSYAGFFDDLARDLEKSVGDKIKNVAEKSLDNIDVSSKKKQEKVPEKRDNLIKNKNIQSAEQKNKPEEASEIIRTDQMKQSDEDAEWEAAIAEEKARNANREVSLAEKEIYKEEVELAIKKNKQDVELARKKDAAERVPVHDDKSPDWYIARKGVKKFNKTLQGYVIDGLSLDMKVSMLEKTLVSNGYKRKSRKILFGGRPSYFYMRKGKKYNSTVEIRGARFDDVANTIIFNLHNTDGDNKIAEEKIRMLTAFSGSCLVIQGYAITCSKHSTTAKFNVDVNFSRRGVIRYTVNNMPHYKKK